MLLKPLWLTGCQAVERDAWSHGLWNNPLYFFYRSPQPVLVPALNCGQSVCRASKILLSVFGTVQQGHDGFQGAQKEKMYSRRHRYSANTFRGGGGDIHCYAPITVIYRCAVPDYIIHVPDKALSPFKAFLLRGFIVHKSLRNYRIFLCFQHGTARTSLLQQYTD